MRYNPGKIRDPSQVVSQPYDRIGPALQGRYYDLSPYNVVRLIQGKTLPTDAPDRLGGPNAYTRAKAYYDLWRIEEVLVREERPALYVYHQTYLVGGALKTRKGLIAALEPSPFDQEIVLPHEQTYSGPKVDRLRLLRTLQVHTGQIFLLYPDPGNSIDLLLDQAVSDRDPDLDLTELFEKDVQQRLWVVTDPATIDAVRELMAPKKNLVIADGHHRYETALNYREEMRQKHPGAPPDAAFHYCMATLVSMDDPGLVILPTHREIYGLPQLTGSDVLIQAAPAFDVIPVEDMASCFAEMEAGKTRHAFGFYAAGQYAVLALKTPDLIDQWIAQDRSLTWRSLDVTILHKILLEGIMGLSAQVAEEQAHLRYHRDPSAAVENVISGEGNCVFFLNPTQVSQVKACAEEGERMPQKSTDFYPKMISGLTIMPAGAHETL